MNSKVKVLQQLHALSEEAWHEQATCSVASLKSKLQAIISALELLGEDGSGAGELPLAGVSASQPVQADSDGHSHSQAAPATVPAASAASDADAISLADIMRLLPHNDVEQYLWRRLDQADRCAVRSACRELDAACKAFISDITLPCIYSQAGSGATLGHVGNQPYTSYSSAPFGSPSGSPSQASPYISRQRLTADMDRLAFDYCNAALAAVRLHDFAAVRSVTANMLVHTVRAAQLARVLRHAPGLQQLTYEQYQDEVYGDEEDMRDACHDFSLFLHALPHASPSLTYLDMACKCADPGSISRQLAPALLRLPVLRTLCFTVRNELPEQPDGEGDEQYHDYFDGSSSRDQYYIHYGDQRGAAGGGAGVSGGGGGGGGGSSLGGSLGRSDLCACDSGHQQFSGGGGGGGSGGEDGDGEGPDLQLHSDETGVSPGSRGASGAAGDGAAAAPGAAGGNAAGMCSRYGAFAQALGSLHQLQALALTGTYSGAGSPHVISSLAQLTQLEALYMSNSKPWGRPGLVDAVVFEQLLNSLTHLESISLSQYWLHAKQQHHPTNAAAANGVSSLAVQVNRTSSTSSDAADASILGSSSGRGGFITGSGLCRSLKPMPCLQRLSLHNVGVVGTDDAGAWTGLLPAVTLFAGAMNLRELNIQAGSEGNATALAVAALLPGLGQLQRLVLSFSMVDCDGVRGLAAALPHVAGSLQELVLSHNTIRDTGMLVLASVLPQMALLRWLDLSANRASVRGEAVVREAFPTALI